MHWYDLLYPLVGALAGVIAGLLGLGGGIVIVPALTMLMPLLGFPAEISMHLALGTSMATIIVTQISSLRMHLKYGQGKAIVQIGRGLWPGLIIGAITGVILADHLSSKTLALIFAIIILLLALRVALLGRQTKSFADDAMRLPKPWWMSLYGIAISLTSSLLGLSGGTFFVPLLQHYRCPIHRAVATSSASGLILASIATVSYMVAGYNETQLISAATGYVYWPAFIGIAIASMLFAPLGVKLAHRLPANTLRWLFVIFLVIVGVKMLFH